MSVIREDRSDWVIVDVDSLGKHTEKAPELHAAHGTRAECGMILDLGAVDYVDSSGLGFLFSLKKELQDQAKRLILVNLQKPVQTALQMVHMERAFPIYADVDSALRQLRSHHA